MAKINPALTAEEWVEVARLREDTDAAVPYREILLRQSVAERGGSKAHMTAAVCLHNQPFGFTRERLVLQKRLYRALVDFDTGWIYNQGMAAIEALGEDLVRIEALLPKEGVEP